MSVSICIPTYKREEQLREALWSCINQTQAIDEIIISDDSPDNSTAEMISQEFGKHKNIRYYHNVPSLKQAANVNSLFQKVSSDFTLLLHDDDLLLPDAVKIMVECITANRSLDAVFGKQIIITHDGTENLSASEELNSYFYRTAAYEGNVLTSLESGFLQQFPNDAYLVRTTLAQRIGYSKTVGEACDFDFGLRLGQSGAKMYFINEFTAKYRISNQSVSNANANDVGLFSFIAVRDLTVPGSSMHYKNEWLRRKAPIAVMTAIKLKRRKLAFQLYFCKWHRQRIFTPGGIKRLLLLLLSLIR